jgi:hypothetical protein
MLKLNKVLIPLIAAIMVSTLNLSPVKVSANEVKKTIRISNQKGYDLSWENAPRGEALVKVSIGKDDIMYTYNDNKNRLSKTSGENTVTYTYDNDSKLISEARGSLTFLYQYDSMNSLIGFTLNNATYNFIKDDDLNVIAITDADNSEVAKYEYDKNGQVSSILGKDSTGNWIDKRVDNSFIGTLNLIRLHSFYYDSETQWYYNGYQYYDSANNKYVGGTDNLDSISTFDNFMKNGSTVTPMVDQQLVAAISTWRTNLMNDVNFGKAIAYSANWYSTLSDVEILARLLYGENTALSADQNAVAWVIINRKNANFGGGTYRGVATQSGQFEPITGASSGTANARVPNTSSSLWSNAVWDACTLLSTSSSTDYAELISKPTGITNQLYFVGLSYFLSIGVSQDAVPTGTGLRYSFNGGTSYVAINTVVIVFATNESLLYPLSKGAITSDTRLDTTGERATHNIFFNT